MTDRLSVSEYWGGGGGVGKGFSFKVTNPGLYENMFVGSLVGWVVLLVG